MLVMIPPHPKSNQAGFYDVYIYKKSSARERFFKKKQRIIGGIATVIKREEYFLSAVKFATLVTAMLN